MTRKVIGQAIGIAMERFSLDEDRAFQYLVRLNTKLGIIAARLVEDGNHPAPAER